MAIAPHVRQALGSDTVSICALGPQQQVVSRIAAALDQEGIAASDEVSCAGPVIVVFNAVTDEVCDAIRASSERDCQRVLTVVVQPEPVDSEVGWRLLQSGAADVIAWDEQAEAEAAVAARVRRWLAVDQLLFSPRVQGVLAGASRNWLKVLRQVVEVAHFTDASVLITGPSGSGKELVARLIHDLDPRPKKGDLVVLDCTTVVPQLSGSEFFGHERGAFTCSTCPENGRPTTTTSNNDIAGRCSRPASSPRMHDEEHEGDSPATDV